MRIKSVELHNYRQYKDYIYHFNKRGEHDLHLIIGRNTMGKTNLLNAITWCIYESESHLDKDKGTLPILNMKARQLALDGGKDFETIRVRVTTEVDYETITYQREMLYSVKSNHPERPIFTVYFTPKSGNTAILENEEGLRYVNKFLPERIKEYFFFDGEQLNSYFNKEKGSRIEEAIRSISQIEHIKNANQRLRAVMTELQTQAGKISYCISSLNENYGTTAERVEQYKRDVSEFEGQIEKSERIIRDNTSFLQGRENLPQLEKEFNYLDKKKKILNEEYEDIVRELYKYARCYKIILSFSNIAKYVLDVIKEKEDNNEIPPNIDNLMLLQMIDKHICLVCNHALEEEDIRFVKAQLDRIKVSSFSSHLLRELKSELRNTIDEARNYKDEKDKLIKRYRASLVELRDVEEKIGIVESEMSKFQDKTKVRDKHDEREAHKILVITNREKLGVFKNQQKKYQEELEDIEESRAKELSKNNQCKRYNQLIEFAKEAAKITEDIEDEMIAEIRERMKYSTMCFFSKLNWKIGAYKEVILDESYNIELIDKDDYPCIGSCSAAERALLTLSFTLALHNTSGFDSLVFIDTPVARVSDENRTNFSKAIKEVSKDKQIILALTPSEYSQEIKIIFENDSSSCVTLTSDEDYTTMEM